MIIVVNNFKRKIGKQVMDLKKNKTRKSKKKVRRKRDTKKPMKRLSEQKLYIGPGPYCEKLPKG